MKAMVWKELRECGIWAVLALMLTVIINIFAYKMSTWSHDLTQLWDGKVVVNTIVASVAGSVLGAMQILPELRRDQWAFLLHRPIAASQIFIGKALAGLLLLVIIICLPDALIFYWVRFHLGQEVISYWYFLSSVYIGLIVAFIFYFAAMIAALRQARIYGSRLLSFFAALAAAAFSLVMIEMWQSLLLAGSCIAILGCAALGCFCAKGEYVRMKALTRFALGAVLLYSGIALGVSLAALIGDAVPEDWGAIGPENPLDVAQPGDSHNLIFADPQGRILQMSWTVAQLSGKEDDYGYGYSGWTLPEKQPVIIPPTRNPNRYIVPGYLVKGDKHTAYGTSKYIKSPYLSFLYDPYSKINADKDSQILYDNINRRIAFYSRKQGRFTGYSGPGGYYDAQSVLPPDKARFPSKLLSAANGKYYWYYNSIYRVEAEGHVVKRIITTKPGETIQSVAAVTENKRQLLWIVTSHAVEKYDDDGVRLYSISLDPTERNSAYVGIVNVSPRVQLLWFGDIQTQWNGQRSLHSKVIETSAKGEVLRRFALPVFPVGEHLSVPFRNILLAVAYPLTVYISVLDSNEAAVEDAHNILGFSYPLFPPDVPLHFPLGSAAVSTIMVWLVGRRCAMKLRQQLLWIALTLPFGPASVLSLLALHAWPVRLRCKQCGSKRDIDCENCQHCNAPWPRPQHNGTEIISREFQTRALAAGGQK